MNRTHLEGPVAAGHGAHVQPLRPPLVIPGLYNTYTYTPHKDRHDAISVDESGVKTKEKGISGR